MKQSFTLQTIPVRLSAILLGVLLCTGTFSLQAQTIPTPPQTDEIIIDNGTPGKADPGDRIRYKVTIENTHPSAPANGVQLNAAPDIRTTLDNTTFRTTPLAINDAYSVIGNVGITVPAANGLLLNDYDDDIPGLDVMAVSNVATTAGGIITIAADGGFSYNPPSGFEGADTYQYTLIDGNDADGAGPIPGTDVGTITFTVSGMIWFINNNAPACMSNCGRLSNPYNSLAAFNTANNGMGLNPKDNHNIFIYESATAYTGGIVLRNGQRLFGQDATATLAAMTGLTLPMFSNPLPTTNPGGTLATITNAAGDGVGLASGNTLRGFTVGACLDFGMENLAAGTVGNLTISEVDIVNTTGGGFKVGNGGALTVTFGTLSSNGGLNGISLNTSTGTFTATGGTITNPTGTGVEIINGTVTFTYGGAISVNTGLAVDIDNHDSNNTTFTGNITSTGMGIRIQNCGGGTKIFSGASKSLTTGANAAVNLVSNAGATINFNGGGLVINTTTGAGFSATMGGTVNVTGVTNTITKSGNGNALNIANVNAGASSITFASINVTGGTGTAISITTSTGTKNLGDVDVARGGGGTGILASAAGTLNTSDGTINSGNQIAIDIDNAALNVVLTSVSANGAANGIEVSNTTGSFNINGVGTTNATGGTIQNITTRGASFINATNITLKNMAFNNANTTDAGTCTYASAIGCNGALYMDGVTTLVLNNVDVTGTAEQGLNGNNIAGMTVINCTFTQCGNAQEEGCMKLRGLSGTCSITGSFFSFGHEELVEIYNAAGSAALTLTVDNCDFTDTQASVNGERGLWLEFSNSVTSTVNVDNCDFLRIRTQGTRLNANGNATVIYNVTDSNFDRQGNPGSGVAIAAEGSGIVDANINRNTINLINDNGVTVEIRNNSNVECRVNNNNITGPGSCAGCFGDGIFFNVQNNAVGVVEARDNNITATTGPGAYGIRSISRNAGSLNATIDNNNIQVGGSAMLVSAYGIEARAGAGDPMESSFNCSHVLNNDVTFAVAGGALAHFRARYITDNTLRLPGAGGTAAAIWDGNLNTLSTGSGGIVSQSNGGGTILFGGSCTTVGHTNAMIDPTESRPGSRLLKVSNTEQWAGMLNLHTNDTSSLHK